jgi:hypothetical protein
MIRTCWRCVAHAPALVYDFARVGTSAYAFGCANEPDLLPHYGVSMQCILYGSF